MRRIPRVVSLIICGLACSSLPLQAQGGSTNEITPAELLRAEPFALELPYSYAWRADKPQIDAGYLVVLAADPEDARIRQAYSPILFVGEWPAEVINNGGQSGRVIAIVPATVPLADLARTPAFYSRLQVLPESLSQDAAQSELTRATRSGIRSSSNPALAAPTTFADRVELDRRAADLIEIYSPGEVDLIAGLRAPALFATAEEREQARRRKPAERPDLEPAEAPAEPQIERGLTGGILTSELAGRSLTVYPFFEFPRSFNQGSGVSVAVDPTLQPQLVGETVSLYVVEAKTVAQWSSDPSLVDVTAVVEQVMISAGSIASNRFTVDSGTLSGVAGLGLGVGYDVVVDADQNGQLSSGDLIDGLSATPGMFVVHDVTLGGPLAVVETLYTGGSFLGQNTFYPATIAGMGELPLVIMSHGNGHNYQWYDHIGNHMASYGYVVMSHQNNTSPGIQTASLTTTLNNTDYFMGNLPHDRRWNARTVTSTTQPDHLDRSQPRRRGRSRAPTTACSTARLEAHGLHDQPGSCFYSRASRRRTSWAPPRLLHTTPTTTSGWALPTMTSAGAWDRT